MTLEPSVFALNEHIEQVDTLLQQVAHYQLPAVVAQLMNLLRQALPTEKRQIANIQSQIAIIRSTQGLSPHAKEVAYRERLLPLVQQEEEIERERVAAGLQEKMLKLAPPATP